VARDEWDLMASTKVHDIKRLAEILATNSLTVLRQPPE
jgi:hypothetical protein